MGGDTVPQSHVTLSVFIFIYIVTIFNNCDGSTYTSSPSRGRFSRQLGFGFGQEPYYRRQQSTEVSLFQSMLSMNFDAGDILAMYRNVTAVAETPLCLGHCRTPIALWVVQSFYPCYNLKKLDCPKGLVCCMQDPSTRIASANTLHTTRIRENGVGEGSSAKETVTSAPDKPTESTTVFDEEWYKHNFIQDEIPE